MNILLDDYPVCPNCDSQTDEFFKDERSGEIIGCTECIKYIDAWEYLEDKRRYYND